METCDEQAIIIEITISFNKIDRFETRAMPYQTFAKKWVIYGEGNVNFGRNYFLDRKKKSSANYFN